MIKDKSLLMEKQQLNIKIYKYDCVMNLTIDTNDLIF
jgi:hypothetical protein